ncbi:ABC transporter ATP-binding protein [Ferrimonas futtsuensis]|uniref:ABC transporter ATP-binding protein n=1 Tax=Ferrimonas futtsuensis TaxID=364764 RepID=UPI00041A67BD|nr:ABC transporter ATP-binding protein [Ferrimonas futtsuensis]
MTQSAVSVVQVSKRFGEVQALDEVSLSLRPGELLGLLGHNGAGKTTLIKLILGLSTPDRGQIRVNGRDPGRTEHRASLSIGYLPEHVSLYDNLSGGELLGYFAGLRRVGKERVEEVLARLQLDYARDRKVRTYSKGMRQRLGLAQAILAEPRVLILDEPTVGLDPQASALFYELVAALRNNGTAVIICTHELTLIDRHLDSALILAKGRELARGSIEELRQEHKLPTKVEVAGAELLASRDMLLAAMYDPQSKAFMVGQEQKRQLLEHLTAHHKIFDFNVLPPSLPEVYQSCQLRAQLEELPC